MQKYHSERIWAIVRESVKMYQQSKALLLFSFGIFMGELVLYILLMAWLVPVNNSEIKQQYPDEEVFSKLEDSVSATNQQLQQYADAINQHFKAGEFQNVGVAPDFVSDRNKRSIIKKIEAILQYLETPLYQFNQLPTYFINNPELEKKIRHYNEEQMGVVGSYNRDRKNDTILFQSLQSAQQQLIGQLNTEKKLLTQQMKKPKKRVQNTLDSSQVLTSLFNKRDSLTQVYSDQLVRYQKQLDQLSSNRLNYPSVSAVRQKERKTAVRLETVHPNLYDLFWMLFLLTIAIVIPFLISVLKLYKLPFIKRLEDLEFPASKTNIKLEFNKDVNQELVAFNYEQLIREIDQLANNKHSIIVFYSVEAGDQQYAIGTQLGSLLAKLGNPVLHIQFFKAASRKQAAHSHAYTISELTRRLEDIQNQLIRNAKQLLHQELYVLMDEVHLKKQDQLSSPLQYYWVLQHFFAKAKVKEMLANFERHFTFVVINMPDFSQLESSLLFIPLKSMNIHVFKNGTSLRKSVNRLCELNANDSLPTIHIIDFLENRIHQSGVLPLTI